MSHPAAHTLEHIEKQHRSITPQPATQQQSQTTPTAILTANSASNTTSSNKTKKQSRSVSQQDSILPTPPSLTLTPMNQSTNDTNGTTGFLRIQSPTNASTSTSTNHQASDISSSSSNPLASLFAHASVTTVSGRVSIRIRCIS